MAIGHGSGDTRAEEAVAEVVNSPLLETSIKNAGKLLVNLTMSEDTPLDDAEKVMQLLTQSASRMFRLYTALTLTAILRMRWLLPLSLPALRTARVIL